MKKNTFTLRKMLLGAALITMIFTVSSCKNDKPDDSKEAAEEQNEQKFDDVNEPKEDDSEYLVAAADTDMMEIELGKLALSKTTNADIKKLANMMIEQHTAASAKTKALAAKKNISLPAALSDEGKAHYDDLNKKSGNDFDEAYADHMVDGHEKAIKKMEDAAKDGNDVEVRQWASDMLPTLATHLEHSKMVKDAVNK